MRLASYLSCMHCNADLTKEGVKRKRCAGCHSVFYDDVACQKKDWAIHKTECKELQRLFIAAVRSEYPEVDTMAKLLARPDACGVIAQCYFDGTHGFEKNKGLCVFWMTQWMKDGTVEAMFMLGMTYTDELVVPGKCKEGVKLLHRLCNLNLGHELPMVEVRRKAERQLAWCYQNGHGVQANQREELKWLRLAAEGGHAEAQAQLCQKLQYGIGVEKDMEEAMTWCRKAAEQGYAHSQLKFGVYLVEVHSEKEAADPTNETIAAVEWVRRAAEQGEMQAQCAFGTCLFTGMGVAKDLTEAVVWYRKSADQGHAKAQFDLGVCYDHGNGVAVDRDEAIRLYRLSADQDFADAKDALIAIGNQSVLHVGE